MKTHSFQFEKQYITSYIQKVLLHNFGISFCWCRLCCLPFRLLHMSFKQKIDLFIINCRSSIHDFFVTLQALQVSFGAFPGSEFGSVKQNKTKLAQKGLRHEVDNKICLETRPREKLCKTSVMIITYSKLLSRAFPLARAILRNTGDLSLKLLNLHQPHTS